MTLRGRVSSIDTITFLPEENLKGGPAAAIWLRFLDFFPVRAAARPERAQSCFVYFKRLDGQGERKGLWDEKGGISTL